MESTSKQEGSLVAAEHGSSEAQRVKAAATAAQCTLHVQGLSRISPMATLKQ